MNFNITSSLGELLTFLLTVLAGVGAWFKLYYSVNTNTKTIAELETRLEKTETRSASHDRDVGIVSANLATIKTEIQGISARLDTIYVHLLKKEKE